MPTAESQLVRQFEVKRFGSEPEQRDLDWVAVEEPLAIRVGYWFKDLQKTESFALAMRTPGHDRELAAGLLLSEGVLQAAEDVSEIRPLGPSPSNEILIELAKTVDFESWQLARSTVMNSSCGVCGKRSIESLPVSGIGRHCDSRSSGASFQVRPSVLERLPELLRSRQAGFSQTGGLHAASLFSATGEFQSVFEDIGRHNALDKLIGSCLLRHQLPLTRDILFLSSRSSFELVQKSAAAGAPILATVGAPSSLAIETAVEYGITLLGFLRSGRFNVYSGDWRIDSK